jgi:indolepyruvate ferredoxin oxidoreductase beta subunit
MKTDIILAGVGGQGILSIATSIGMAALINNLHIKQAEVHGMSQRGGAVQSHLRIADYEIASDLIPYGATDIIISVEPMEALRYLPFLAPGGWVVTNTIPFINIPNYPAMDKIMKEIESLKNFVALDADKIATDLGSIRASNMVMLGASSPFLNLPYETIEKGIKQIFGRKGEEVVEINLKALRAGRELAQKKM